MSDLIEHQVIKGVHVVRILNRNFDGAISMHLRDQVLSILQKESFAADQRRCLVLDVERVQFIDSSGLGVLRQWSVELGQRRIAIAKVCGRLRLCLGRMPENRTPRIFESVGDAIEHAIEESTGVESCQGQQKVLSSDHETGNERIRRTIESLS